MIKNKTKQLYIDIPHKTGAIYNLDIKRWNPLISSNKELDSSISIVHYLPENSDEFVIIRK